MRINELATNGRPIVIPSSATTYANGPNPNYLDPEMGPSTHYGMGKPGMANSNLGPEKPLQNVPLTPPPQYMETPQFPARDNNIEKY